MAGLGVAAAGWLLYSLVQNSRGYCLGAPLAYGTLRTLPAPQRLVAFRRLPLTEQIAVYRADQRCGRPSHLSLSTLIGDRDSSAVPELVGALGGLRTAADTSVVVQLLAYAKCVRGLRLQVDSSALAGLTATIAGMPEGSCRNSGVAALNRVDGRCGL